MKKIVVLGSTGSIGRQTLDIVRAFPEEFEVVGLAAGNNVAVLREQIREFSPRYFCSQTSIDPLPSGARFTPMSEMVCLDEVTW